MPSFSRRRNMDRLAIALALIPLVASLPAQMPVFSVQVDQAEEREAAEWLEFTGTIEPWRMIDLAAQVEGRVEAVAVEEGQRLEAGTVVCTLDTEAAQIELERLRALQQRAEAELSMRESGYRTEDVEAARRDLEAAEARLETARDEWERAQPLVEEGVIAAGAGTRLRALYNEAQAEVKAAQTELAKQEAGFRTEEIEMARADLAVTKAQVAEAERRIRRSQVATPVACAVVERLKEPGEWVSTGDSVARVAVLDPLKLRVEIPQRFLSQVREGLDATIHVDGLPGETFHAQVSQIIPVSGEATRNFPIWMRLPNPENKLRGGLFAQVALSLGEKKPMITVPGEAVQARGERLVVLVADPMPQDLTSGAPQPGRPGNPGRPDGAGKPDAAGGEAGGPPGGGGPPGMPPMPQPNAIVREVEVRVGPDIDGRVALDILSNGPIQPGDQIVILGGKSVASGMPVHVMERNLLAPQEGVPGGEGGPPSGEDGTPDREQSESSSRE